ncbi:MAG TPA: serine/threonine-protein kinase [Acidobacteriaceae bacterium]|jgi:non-specific serine/threonine protein kinase/serine/threonine-protein kinase
MSTQQGVTEERDRWQKVRRLVEAAMELPDAERLSFVRGQSEDTSILSDAEQLLQYDDDASAMFAAVGTTRFPPGEMDSGKKLSGVHIGAYRVLNELGRGGMGVVYLAERADGAYTQLVAVKVLQEGFDTAALAARFLQERQILAGLTHPGIARLLDGGVLDDGRPYLVLEYVDGIPLDTYCHDHALNIRERLNLVLRVADAVQSAHQNLVLHLDLKPANILVTQAGEPRLLDFGIARLLSENGSGKVEVTTRLLTPRYASPEQAAGTPLGVASDVFSLATLLYRLLTGVLPYPLEDASPLETARIIRERPPKPPSQAAPPELREQLRGDLDVILLQALRKEPERRYATVADLAADLQRHLESKPVHAHADSFRYRAEKFIRRNRTSVAAASLAILVLLGSGVAVVRSAVIARQQRAAAERERATAERRLKGMRALAHSYVFDLDPKLEVIAGTVDVRHFVLQNAQKYLEAMSSEVSGDDDLTRETAEGYSRVGQVLDTPDMVTLHDPARAAASMQKGIELQKALVAKHPDNLKDVSELIRQMRHYSWLGQEYGDVEGSYRLSLEDWDIAQPILKAGPSQPRFEDLSSLARDIASDLQGEGDRWNLADPMAALPWLKRSERIREQARQANLAHAESFPMLEGYEHIQFDRGNFLIETGEPEKARPYFEEAYRLTSTGEKNAFQDYDRKAYRMLLAEYLLLIHDPQAAAKLEPELLAAFDDAGKDKLLNSDAAETLIIVGRIEMETGKVTVGKARVERGLEELEAILKKNPSDASVSAPLAWHYFRCAHEPAFDLATRTRMYRRSIEIADAYRVRYPMGLSATMLVGRCELELAKLARQGGKQQEARSIDESAQKEFAKVLAAHPVQPLATKLLAEAIADAAKT